MHADARPPPAPTAPLFYRQDEDAHGEGSTTVLGFWIYLMSDCLIFASLFATFGVLGGNYAGGPVAARTVRPAARGAQYASPAGLVDHLRLRDAGDADSARSARR